MKAIALFALLLVSITFLGCVQEQPEQGEESGEFTEFKEQPFESEEAALAALEKELEGADDLDLSEIEKALQE